MQCTAQVRLWDADVLKFAHPPCKLTQLPGSMQSAGNDETLDTAYCKDLLYSTDFFLIKF